MALPGVPFTNIAQFRQTIRDISRAYLFMVRMPFVGSDLQLTSFARSATLPSYKLSPVEVKFQSQTLRLAGPADFDGQWTVRFLCDEAHSIRHKFLAWQSVAYDPSIMVHGAPSQYKDDRCQVHQLDRRGNSIAVYNFVGLFPSEVGQIDIAHDNIEPEQFDVTFTYDYWTLNAQNAVGGVFLGINQNGVSVGLPGLNTSVGGNSASINTTIGTFGLNVAL
jgi:hypothetical protein